MPSMMRSGVLLACLAHLVQWSMLEAAAEVSSGDSVFTCELEQRGFHILRLEDCVVSVWIDSLRSQTPRKIALEKGATGRCEPDFLEIAQRVEDRLKLTKREPYQQPWRYFTPQGAHVADKAGWDAAVKVGPVFLIEGGQFQWPPVSVGFKQQVDGLLSKDGAPIELETMSIRPPIFRIYGLASEQETNALIEYSKPHLEEAGVIYMDHDKGKAVDEFRTSLNYRPDHNETPLLATMEARAAALTRIPPSHFEEVQILEYQKGGYYHAHDDAARLEFYSKDRNTIVNHQYGYFDRMATVFWYMNTVVNGGETNFPRANGGPSPYTMTKCVQGLMVAPVQGMAVMWYNLEPRGLVDPFSLHAACAVGDGVKHAINIWVYNKPRDTQRAKWDPKHPRVKVIRGGNDDDESEDDQFSIVMANEAASNVEVYWNGPDSDVKMAELQPGQSTSMNTYKGHRFTAKLPDGTILNSHIMKGNSKRQKFVISDSATKEL